MNEKFFRLPEEKQLAIINAGYRIFSQNSYKKSPVSEIAAEAGISKSLLFHYFKNKKELYMYLIENSVKLTYAYLNEYKSYEQQDFFEIMLSGLKAKVALMRKYPDIMAFTLKSYYESDPEVVSDIQELIGKTASYEANAPLLNIDPDSFIEGLDLEMMYKEMYFASEGYLWEKTQQGCTDIDEMERDIKKMIEFWRSVYTGKKDEK